MGLIKPNLTDVSDPLAIGDYKVRVLDVLLAETQTGKQQLKVEMEIFGNDAEENNGKKTTAFLMIAGKGAFRLMDFWAAATGEALSKDCSELDTDQVVGKELIVTMQEEKDQNGNVKKFPGVGAFRALA